MDQRRAFEIVERFLSLLQENQIDVRKAYLFGSYAKGGHSEDSDIDLAVVVNNLQNSFLMQVELMKLGRKIDSRIESHPFDVEDFDSSNPFAHEIMTTGIQIL